MSSHFNKVLEFSKAFEVDSIQLHKCNKEIESKLVKFRISLIQEEAKELQEAIANNDRIEVIDALIDILYVVHGAFITFEHTPNFDINRITTNNVQENMLTLLSDEVEEYTMNVLDNKYNDKELQTIQDILFLLVDYSGKDCSNIDILDKSNEIIMNYCLKIISPAFRLHKQNICDLIPFLQIILNNTYKCLAAFGIDTNTAFKIVHDSNMSKLCDTEKQAIATVEWYKNSDKYKLVYDSPSYRKSKGSDYYIVYNESTNKVLKNIDYIPANFSSLFEKSSNINITDFISGMKIA